MIQSGGGVAAAVVAAVLLGGLIGLGIATWLTPAPGRQLTTWSLSSATVTITDPNYQGSATGTFLINKADATVTLSNLTQTYTGSPLTPTA